MEFTSITSLLQKVHKYFKLEDPEEAELFKDSKPADAAPAAADEKFAPNQLSNIDLDHDIEIDQAHVRKIFDKVVEITNKALPQYLASSVDPEKQKKYLYDALDESVKEYLGSLENDAQARCMMLWQKEREELKVEMDKMRQRTRELEAKRTEMNEQRLSADRQKRALNDRIHDLEAKIIELEAEREQLDIENKSLINKAKAANVYESDIEAMRQELDELKANNPVELQSKLNSEIARNTGLTEENSRLKDELQRLEDSLKTARMKDEMGDAMVKDMQKRASEALKNLKESNTRVAELEQTNIDANERIALLEQEVKRQSDTISALQAEVAHKDESSAPGGSNMAELEAIMEQVEKFGKVKEKLEERISSLRLALDDTKKENETLKTTIKNNLYEQARQEKELKDKIARLEGNVFEINEDEGITIEP